MTSGQGKSPRGATRALPFAVIFFCCALMALAARSMAYHDPANSQLIGLDFRAFYTAGKMLLNGAPLYDLSQQWAWQKLLWPQLSQTSELLYIPYPPFDILPMALVALFPLHVAYAVWMGAQTLLLIALCYLLINSVKSAAPRTRIVMLLFCITSVPVLLALVHGQMSFMLALSALLAWHNCKAGREKRAGIWLSLLLIKPQFFLVPLLVFLLLRRGRVLLGMLIGGGVLFLLSLLLVGPQGLLDYLRLLASASHWGEAYGIHPQEMHSWRALLHQVLQTNDSARTLWPWLIGIVAILGLSLWTWRIKAAPESARFDLQWALLLFATTLCSPHTNAHDLCLLLVAGGLIFNASTSSALANLSLRHFLVFLPIAGYCVLWIWFILAPRIFNITIVTIPFQIFTLAALAYSCWHLARSEEKTELPQTVAA